MECFREMSALVEFYSFLIKESIAKKGSNTSIDEMFWSHSSRRVMVNPSRFGLTWEMRQGKSRGGSIRCLSDGSQELLQQK